MLESIQMADERRAQMFRQLNNQKTMLIEHATAPNNCNTCSDENERKRMEKPYFYFRFYIF
jgi:hypothetical protein